MANQILQRFLAGTTKREVDIADFIRDSNRDIPLNEWQSMVDVTKHVAIDAKSLNSNEWCNKYKSQLKTLDRTESSGSKSRSFGLSLAIPKMGTIGGNYGSGRNSTNNTTRTLDSLLATEDCGKSLVENSFKFDFDGTRYEPKSIFAYERNTQSVNSSANDAFDRYETSQRLGRNEWRLP